MIYLTLFVILNKSFRSEQSIAKITYLKQF